MAEQGYLVDGIDFEEEMILRAREKSEDMNLTGLVNFQAADMSEINELFEGKEFQTIICMGNTLPHITERAERTGILRQFHDHLSSDGVLILQILNYEKILADKPDLLPVIETEHVVFTRSYSYTNNGSPLTFTTSIRTKETGEIYTGSTQLAPITADELTEELSNAGFSGINLFGGYSGEAYDPYTSNALLCTAHL